MVDPGGVPWRVLEVPRSPLGILGRPLGVFGSPAELLGRSLGGRILERAPPNGINPCRRTGAAIMQITYEGRSRSELSIKGCVAMMPI